MGKRVPRPKSLSKDAGAAAPAKKGLFSFGAAPKPKPSPAKGKKTATAKKATAKKVTAKKAAAASTPPKKKASYATFGSGFGLSAEKGAFGKRVPRGSGTPPPKPQTSFGKRK